MARRRRTKKKQTELMGAWEDLINDIKAQRAKGLPIDVTMNASLVLDHQAAEETAFSVGSLIVERIKGELDASGLQPLPQTRDRRRRALHERPGRSRTGGRVRAERYPAGWTPNPAGKYGEDSGYLRHNLQLNIDKGKADVFAGIPRNRGKAAFVLRRSSTLLRGGPELGGAIRETTRLRLKKIIAKAARRATRKGLRGTDIRLTFLK